MVDLRPEILERPVSPSGGGGPFVALVNARFVLAGAAVVAAVALGIASSGVHEPEDETRVKRIPDLRLDPNTVPPEVLTALPHVGPALVERWVKAREERPFDSLEDARARVGGLGPATLEQIARYFDNWESERKRSTTLARRKTSRAPVTLQTVLRKKSGSKRSTATQAAGLASRPVSSGDH